VKTKLLIGLVGLGLVAGCGWQMPSSHHYSYWIDPGFTSEQQIDIYNGINAWEVATNRTVTFTEVASPNNVPDVLIITPFGMDLARDKTVGWCWRYPGTTNEAIQLAANVARESFKVTVQHELGHAVGLPHDREGTLMYYKVGSSNASHITCRDVEVFCTIWACDSSKMPVCQQ